VQQGRGSGSTQPRPWQPPAQDPTLSRKIARRIKDSRDEYFETQDGEGRVVNRLRAIASLGGAAHDSEECALIVKAMRALGLVFIEHQARI
jgi:formate dehydrogenase major subunit